MPGAVPACRDVVEARGGMTMPPGGVLRSDVVDITHGLSPALPMWFDFALRAALTMTGEPSERSLKRHHFNHTML
ncbi:MAG: hypothetical protein ACNA8K_13495 [Cyclonatronaceae bacterium]